VRKSLLYDFVSFLYKKRLGKKRKKTKKKKLAFHVLEREKGSEEKTLGPFYVFISDLVFRNYAVYKAANMGTGSEKFFFPNIEFIYLHLFFAKTRPNFIFLRDLFPGKFCVNTAACVTERYFLRNIWAVTYRRGDEGRRERPYLFLRYYLLFTDYSSKTALLHFAQTDLKVNTRSFRQSAQFVNF
jgi:hypothetical protein